MFGCIGVNSQAYCLHSAPFVSGNRPAAGDLPAATREEADMSDVAATTCQCGCNIVTDVTNASEPCGCGCACCAERPKNVDDEIAELHTLRTQIERRLAELDRD